MFRSNAAGNLARFSGRWIRFVVIASLVLGSLSVTFARGASADTAPAVSVNSVTTTRPASGTTSLGFTVTLEHPVNVPVTVNWTTSDGTAVSGTDYQQASGSVNFTPGATTRPISVVVDSTTLHTGDRYFNVVLSGAVNATIVNNVGIGTIIDPTALPYANVSDATVVQGAGSSNDAVFTVSLTAASANPVTIKYTTENGSAVAGHDFTYTNGTLDFAAGTTSEQVSVPVTAVDAAEPSLYFYLNIAHIMNAAGDQTQGIGYILNSNHTAYITVDDAAITKPSSGTGTMTFPVHVAGPAPTSPVTFSYSTEDGSAVAGVDYTAAYGTATIPAGSTSVNVPVKVSGGSESSTTNFYLNISGASSGASIFGHSQGIGTIVRASGGQSQITIADAGVVEPSSGKVDEVITVKLAPAATGNVAVDYATANNTAVAPSQYTPTSGVVTFTPGATKETISVPVVADSTVFTDSSFLVNLSSVTGNATLQRNSAFGVIETENLLPELSLGATAVVKPATGTVTATFPVTLSKASPNTVNVNYATSDGSATTANGDYKATTGTVTFSPGQTSKNISVTVQGNTRAGSNIYFYVTISGPVNAADGETTQVVGYIENVFSNPTLSIDNVSIYKGQSGTQTATLTATLAGSDPNPVTVDYATEDGSAVAGTDYVSTSGSLTFPAGTTTETIKVPVDGNTLPTGSRYFYVNLSGATNASIVSGQARIDIIDSSIVPVVSVSAPTVTRPSSGTAPMPFVLSLSSPSPNKVTVNYATSDGSGIAGGDYTATSGTATFAAGTPSVTVDVPVLGSTLHTGGRYFYLNLSSPTNAQLGYQSANAGQIVDPTFLPALSIPDVSVKRPTSGTGTLTFKVTLTPASPNAVTVHYATSDGSAVAGTDYDAASGTLDFPAGATSESVPVTMIGKATSGSNQYFYLNLSSPTEAQIERSYAVGYELDEVAPAPGTSYLSVNDATIVKPASGTANEVFAVTLEPAATEPVTVNYSTADGSATVDDNDYTSVRGTLTFAAGQTSQTVTVPAVGNQRPGPDLYFDLNLGANTGPSQIERSSGQADILDNQPQEFLSVGPDAQVVKGDTGSESVTETVTLDIAKNYTVQADYYTEDGSAVAPKDYTPKSGTLTFAPGQTSASVTLTIPGNPSITGESVFYFGIDDAVGPNGSSVPVNPGLSAVYVSGIDTFTVSGTVVGQAGTGLSGVTVTLSGNNRPVTTMTTTSTGAYSFTNVVDGPYTVTPTKSATTFLPAKSSITVRGGSVTVAALLGYTGVGITGQALLTTAAPAAGVTVTRTGGGQGTATAVTDSAGYYAFSSVPSGSGYVVKPTESGFTFNPASYTVSVSGTTVGSRDFVAVTPAFITGRVTSASAGLAGVTVTRTGGGISAATTTTNSQGYYGFSAVPATSGGTSYTITPTLSGDTFNPEASVETVSTTSNATGVNFAKS